MIYAIHILDQKFVKIGFTDATDISRRMAELQTGCPFELRMLACMPGNLPQEKRLHALLKDAFITIRVPVPPNEWYPGRNQMFQEFLRQLIVGVDQAVLFLDARIDHRGQATPSTKDGRDGLWAVNICWPKNDSDAGAKRFGTTGIQGGQRSRASQS